VHSNQHLRILGLRISRDRSGRDRVLSTLDSRPNSDKILDVNYERSPEFERTID